MGYSRANQIEPPRWVAAIVGFFGTMAFAMAASFFVGKSWSYGGQWLTAAMLACIPAAIVLYIIRRATVEFIVAWVGLLLLALCLWALVAMHVRRTIDLAVFDREAVELFKQARERVAAIDAGRAVDLGPMPTKPESDHPGELVKFHTKNVLWQRSDSYRRYIADLEASQWSRMTEPKVLRERKEREQLNVRFDAAKAAIDAWEARERESAETYAKAMGALPLPQELRARLDKNIETYRRDMGVMIYAERMVLFRAKAFASTLIGSRWTLQGDAVMFYDDTSLYAFERAQEQLQSAIRQSESVVAQINQRADALIERESGAKR